MRIALLRELLVRKIAGIRVLCDARLERAFNSISSYVIGPVVPLRAQEGPGFSDPYLGELLQVGLIDHLINFARIVPLVQDPSLAQFCRSGCRCSS